MYIQASPNTNLIYSKTGIPVSDIAYSYARFVYPIK